MAITNGYATLAELKARLNITDTSEDTILEAVIEAASRSIDSETGRVFYAASETRYYTAEDYTVLFVDDLLEVTSLKSDINADRVYETEWTTTDYDLEPYNARSATGEKVPYTRVRLAPYSTRSFPTVRKGVEIVGSWGYCATGSHPKAINEACLLMAARLFKRKDAPFGVLANPEFGAINLPRLDPDVRLLIRPYVRPTIGAV